MERLVLASFLVLALIGCWRAYANNKRAERFDKAIVEAETPRAATVQAKSEENKATVGQWAMQATLQQEPTSVLGDIQQVIKLTETKGRHQFEDRTQESIRNALTHLTHRSKLGPYKKEVNEVVFAPQRLGRRPLERNHEHEPVVAVGGRDGYVQLWNLGDYDNPNDDKSFKPIPSRPSKTRGSLNFGSIGSCSLRRVECWRSAPAIPRVRIPRIAAAPGPGRRPSRPTVQVICAARNRRRLRTCR